MSLAGASARWTYTLASLIVLLFALDRVTVYRGTLGEGIVAIAKSLALWASTSLALDSLHTLARVGIGFLIAAVLGIGCGLVTGVHAKAAAGITGTLNYLRAITPVALAPFFLVTFGIGETSKVLLVSWGAFFPIWINTHLGVRSLPTELVACANLMDLPPLRTLFHFYLPAALGAGYPGARIAIGVSFILVYISETLGADFGIGYRLGVAYDTIQMPRMSAALLVLGTYGLLADRLFVIAVRRLAPWILYERPA